MKHFARATILLAVISSFSLIEVVRAADPTPPSSFAALTGTLGGSGWFTTTVAVNIYSDDLESGVKSITYGIDGGAPLTSSFSTGVNLAPNPSFENGAIDAWTISGSANFSQDPSEAKFDGSSAKIISSDTGLKAWQTQSGIFLTAGKTYTFSAWAKFSGVTGGGVKLILDSAASPAQTGSSDWTKIYLNYTPSSDGNFTPQLGIDGPGTVNFDGVSLTETAFPPEVGFVVSTSGNHTMTYFATNNDNVAEAEKTVAFKMDAQGPGNWRSLAQIESGNDHTFKFEITVDDTVSGLATNTGEYQYSLDGGSTWGYYSDLLSCNSTWIQDGWISTVQSPDNPGVSTTTLKTPSTDFCDSDFGNCEKKVRFRIKDIAGNFSARDHCLNSAWFLVQGGDIHSVGSISPSALAITDWLATSFGTIGNLTSNVSWLLPDYGLNWTLQSVYDQWWSFYYSGAQALPGGKLPASGTGFYRVASSFTVDGNTLPANISTADVTAVVFINGNLSINSDFSMKSTSSYIFIISGNLLINGSVKNMTGTYLSQGEFDDHSGGSSKDQLTLSGAAWAIGGYKLDRDLGKSQNTSTPSEKFVLQPGLFLNQNLRNLLAGEAHVSWREVDPDDEPCPP
jgi:hypothetical protein